MSTTIIEAIFLIFGLAALFWAITSPNAGFLGRLFAGLFGVVALTIALVLHGEDRERERW